MSDTQGERQTGLLPEIDWRRLYTLGAIAALVALAGTLADIVIAMIPGWGSDTVPTPIEQWFTHSHIHNIG